ncbi:uncharacterized protein LOC117306380 [Asterias rubens]|uniref:uncharacterized protein LOC117306380 n=1 Tax=Asterias rubens TaxID=7604 RepID=UPI001455608D|nr:uncharacterized protein LOC117306380 [Asterias rubens]XP_033646883.1 uncharacterized protein LOC117306380 [Asterias rubens]
MRLTRTVVMLFLMASILIHAICCDELTDSIARDGRSLAARLSQDADKWKVCFVSTTFVCFCGKLTKLQACYNPKEFKYVHERPPFFRG